MEKLHTIKIGEVTYPCKVDLNVLEELQSQFGSVNAFELELLGLQIVRAEDGTIQYTENGDPKMKMVEPSIKAIKAILPLMINEGLEIEAEQNHTEFSPVDANTLIRNCNTSFEVLAKKLHAEYKRAFATKK